MKKVSLPLTGACQCRAIRYSLAAAPLTLYCCHCTECQHQSSSAFGMSALVRPDDLTVDWSQLRVWSRFSDSGGRLDCHFCPTCGGRLFHVTQSDQAIVSIKAGSFDDRSWLRPVGNLWTGSKQPGVILNEDLLNYETQPEDFCDLEAAWARFASTTF